MSDQSRANHATGRDPLMPLRRQAKSLRKAYEAEDSAALSAVQAVFPNPSNGLKHADFLHVIARLYQFDSWPKLKSAIEQNGLDILGRQGLLHLAAQRMSSTTMVELLLDRGADPTLLHAGVTAYGYGRVLGSLAFVKALEKRGLVSELTNEEVLLSKVAEGQDVSDAYIDTAKLPEIYRQMMHELVRLPNRLDHIQSLVAIGMEYDRPDREGLTPVQLAGWEGKPEVMGYFLKLGPDLSHINGYGGTLLSSIVDGIETCPHRAERDHIGCARLALHHGVALPKALIQQTGNEEMSDFLAEWASERPGQVV